MAGNYKSFVNLGLPEKPLTKDPKLFGELVPVFNALHNLNAGLGGLSKNFVHTFTAPAVRDIDAGKAVTILNAKVRDNGTADPYIQSAGVVLGGYNSYTTNTPALNLFALTSGLAGENILVGMGPALIDIENAPVGRFYYSRVFGANAGAGTPGAFDWQFDLYNDGALYFIDNNTAPPTLDYAPIGFCVLPGKVLIYPSITPLAT